MQNVFFIVALYTKMEGVPSSWFIGPHCNMCQILIINLTNEMFVMSHALTFYQLNLWSKFSTNYNGEE